MRRRHVMAARSGRHPDTDDSPGYLDAPGIRSAFSGPVAGREGRGSRAGAARQRLARAALVNTHPDAADAVLDEGFSRNDEFDVRAVGRSRRHDRGVSEFEAVELGLVGEGDDDVRVADPDREPRPIHGKPVRGDQRLPCDDERPEVDLEAVGSAGQLTYSAAGADRDGVASTARSSSLFAMR